MRSAAAMNKLLTSARKIYIDANVLIYFVEGNPEFQDRAARVLEYAATHAIPIITSDITVAECLYGAYRLGLGGLAEKYEWFFREGDVIDLIPVGRGICKSAAEIGVRHRLKLIDAVHVASALDADCDVLVTNDKGIRPEAGLPVLQLSAL